ncbi:hypothetical protein JYT71_00445 [Acidimicrobiaceae bacterium AH-315-P05]|nr:hypothetical protein [Acidimicrobiaceae bacterium AH-315-P05]
MTDQPPADEEFDPVVAAWAAQGVAGAAHAQGFDPDVLADSVARAHRKDQRRLLWLNVREFVPSVVVAGLFARRAPNTARPPAMLSAAALVFGVGVFLVVSSLRYQRADRGWGTSIREQVARRLAQVEHRAKLYRNVGWWYLSPIAVAVALVRYGRGEAALLSNPVFFGIIAAMGSALYVINRRIGRTRYESEAEHLRTLLADFDAGS